MIGLIGKKVGMTQIFGEGGEVIPVTMIKAGPCPLVQKKTEERDSYKAIQLGFEDKKENRVNKPQRGHFAKAGVGPKRVLKEFRVDGLDGYEVGKEIKVDIFKEEDMVDIIGISKGKGFAGVMKKWGFAGGPASHGAHKWHRRPGSIGSSADPSRVFKGKKMPGRAGGRRVTCKNLKIVKVDRDQNLLLVKGAVPGHNGGYLIIVEKEGTKVQNNKGAE